MFRGHKGREVAEIERGLRDLEDRARPLFARIKQLEEDGVIVARHVKRLEGKTPMSCRDFISPERHPVLFISGLTNHSANEIEAIVVELDHASKTTNKLTDSSRINGIPQRYNFCIMPPKPFLVLKCFTVRFLTKYLVVRLQDHLVNEKSVLKTRQEELLVAKTNFRYTVDTALAYGTFRDIMWGRPCALAEDWRGISELRGESCSRLRQVCPVPMLSRLFVFVPYILLECRNGFRSEEKPS